MLTPTHTCVTQQPVVRIQCGTVRTDYTDMAEVVPGTLGVAYATDNGIGFVSFSENVTASGF